MERNHNMSQQFKYGETLFTVGDRIRTTVSPLNDEINGRKPTPIGEEGVIIAFKRNNTLILFDNAVSNRHNEASAYGIPIKEARNRSWWVNYSKFTLAKSLSLEDKQKQKEQRIINKCKQLDANFIKYQKRPKRLKHMSFSQYKKEEINAY